MRSGTHQSRRVMGPKTFMQERPIETETNAAVKETGPAPGYDQYYLSEDEQKELGIDPQTEEYSWVRNPEMWRKHEGKDRARQFMHENPGGRIPLVNGFPYDKNDDLILAVRPKAIGDQVRERDYQAAVDYEKRIHDLEHNFDRKNEAHVEKSRREMIRFIREGGYIQPNSPTHRLSLESAYQNLIARFGEKGAKEHIERTEEKHRLNNRSIPASMRESQGAEPAKAQGGKQFGGFQKATFLKGPQREATK